MFSSLKFAAGRTNLSPFPAKSPAPPTQRARAAPAIICFRDENSEDTFPASRVVAHQLNRLRIEFSPWGAETLDGYGKIKAGDGGNRGGNDDDDGKGRRPGPGDNSEEKNSPTPVVVTLLLTFSALHLGYCIVAWMRKDSSKLGLEFYGLGLGLVSLLAASAVFVSIGAASDAYVFKLWSFVAAMIGTGETCFVHKHGRLSGFMTLFGISTVTMLSCL